MADQMIDEVAVATGLVPAVAHETSTYAELSPLGLPGNRGSWLEPA